MVSILPHYPFYILHSVITYHLSEEIRNCKSVQQNPLSIERKMTAARDAEVHSKSH